MSVGPAVMIYQRGEGVEELEGTLNLRTMDALRGAGGIWISEWTGGWTVILLL